MSNTLTFLTMNFNIFNTLILSGVLQGLIFFAAVISNKKYQGRANTYLAFTVLFLSISNLNYYAWDVGLMNDFPFLVVLHVPWALTLAPCFYLYVRYSVTPAIPLAKPSKRYGLLFLPFVVLSLSIWGIRLYAYLLDRPTTIKSIHYFYLELVNLTAIISAAVASFRLLNGYRAAKKIMPDRLIMQLDWLRKMLLISCIIIICWVILIIMDMATDINHISLFYPLWLSLTLWIYWVGYTGIYQAKLAQDRAEIRKELRAEKPSHEPMKKVLQKTGNKEEVHFNQIVHLLENEKMYTNPSLGLQDIGDRLRISPNYVSKIVNTQANMSFTDLVNQYRHEMVKELLQGTKFKNYKIMAIALEAGFNSKSNFYKHFKSVEGMTPTEYLKKLREPS